MRDGKGRCGLADYARLLRVIVDQPGTALELAGRTGMEVRALRRILVVMRSEGVIQEVSMRDMPGTKDGASVFGCFGPPVRPIPDVEYTRSWRDLCSFCALIQLLMERESSRRELAEDLGIAIGSMRLLIPTLLSCGLIYVEFWRKHLLPGSPPVPMYRFGIDKPSAQRPRPQSWAAISRKRRHNEALRSDAADLLFLTAGRVRPAPTKVNERTT